ncbi:MAG: hypothetical protein ACOYJG_13070 [Prevotella sp.]|jgi:peptidoglycan hydrolase CwlO-like protein
MKRRFFSTLLMGVLVIASMSMVTSCKDYDDDIDDLQTQIDNLSTVKADLESEIADLTTQLESAQSSLTTLTSQVNSNTTNISTNATAIEKNAANIASLTSQLETANQALEDINAALATKASTEDLNKIYAELKAVDDDLADKLSTKANASDVEAVKKDLEQQSTALDIYKDQLDSLANVVSSLDFASDVTEVTESIADLKSQIETLSDKVDSNTSDVTTLKTDLKDLSDNVDALQTSVNTLNVLLDQKLRSLVFIPQSYYYGIEATSLDFLNFYEFKLPETAWNKKETKGYDDDVRYDSVPGTKVLTFAATYHMNPSSAKLDSSKVKVSVLSNDLKYENTRAAAAGLSVKSWSTADGILTVNLDVADPNKIKSVAADQMVTNFAAKVNLGSGTEDTTVTSDYATLYTESVSGLKLALTNNDVNGHLYSNDSTETPKSTMSPCTITGGTDWGHLMQTVYETYKNSTIPQVYCLWNEELDLSKFVETHYLNKDSEEVKLDDATLAANLEYKFELTAYYNGANKTDESAHAAISGNTFRPQAVAQDGSQMQFGSDQNRASEVGRTPVVRVSLVDKETGKVYDYGYIRIILVDTAPTVKEDTHVDYTGAGYVYNGECTPQGWSYQTTWNVTEYDLYKALGLTRDEFVANYNDQPDGDVDDLDQYSYNDTTKTFTKLADADKIGTVSTVTDISGEVGSQSSTLKWEMTGAEAYKFFVTDKKGGTGVAVKYTSKDKTVGPDVYVYFKTGSTVTINTPSASVNWDAIKNSTVWAKTNAAQTGTGLDEIHVNVPSVEDEKTTTAEPFEKVFSDVFVGNKINAANLLSNLDDKTAGKEYAVANLNFKLVFDASNNGKEYKGASGKTYVMKVTNDSTLQAYVKGTPTTLQTVATIEDTADINNTKIVYQQTAFAKDLLNYKAHNELDNNTIKAIIGLQAKNKVCGNALKLNDNTFDVRFLRPINITNETAEVEDANTTELQTIKLMDLLTFTDWRDAWDNDSSYTEGYEVYYGITGVTVEGVNDGEKISTNSAVLTNQDNHDPMVPLNTVNGAIDFTYSSDDMGTLTYRNYSSTTADFKVQIPVIVHYLWGDVPQTITVNVKHTHNNAKKF